MDFAQWARERLWVDPAGKVPARALYEDYLAWARRQEPVLGDVILSHVQFGRAAVSYGLRRSRGRGGRTYVGVSLR